MSGRPWPPRFVRARPKPQPELSAARDAFALAGVPGRVRSACTADRRITRRAGALASFSDAQAPAEFAGRATEHRAELMVEVREVIPAGGERDLAHGFLCLGESPRGMVEPDIRDEAGEGAACEATELPAKSGFAHVGFGEDFAEMQRLGEAIERGVHGQLNAAVRRRAAGRRGR